MKNNIVQPFRISDYFWRKLRRKSAEKTVILGGKVVSFGGNSGGKVLKKAVILGGKVVSFGGNSGEKVLKKVVILGGKWLVLARTQVKKC